MMRINHIRRQNPALQDTSNIRFAKTTSEKIICYVKRDEASGNTMIIAVNIDPFNTQSAHVTIPLAMLGLTNTYSFEVRDLLSGDCYTWQGDTNWVQLNPYEMPAHVFLVHADKSPEAETIPAQTNPSE